MKVAYVTSRFPHLNTTFVLDEMLAFERLGHEVLVMASRRPIYRPEELHRRQSDLKARILSPGWLLDWSVWRANLRALAWSPLRYARTLAALFPNNGFHPIATAKAVAVFPKAVWFARVASEEHVDWLHAHFASLPTTVAWIASRMSGIPYSFTGYAFDILAENSMRVANPMLPEKVRSARFLVATGSFLKEFILDKTRRDFASKIHVIPNGIALELFPAAGVDTSENHKGPLRIVSVGTYTEKKGHEYLIDACALLKERGVAITCTIIGPGDRRPYGARVALRRLEDEVELSPPLPQEKLIPQVAGADVFVLASVVTPSGDRDGIPTALAEAMSLERAVVTTPISSIPDLVDDGNTGLLVAERDAEALADAIQRLADHKELRASLGRRGREHVMAHFDVHKNATAVASLIQEALDGQRARCA